MVALRKGSTWLQRHPRQEAFEREMDQTVSFVWRDNHQPDVGVGHRRQRMVFHARLAEQTVADEEVAVVERARVGGKGRTNQRQRRIEFPPATLPPPGRCCLPV